MEVVKLTAKPVDSGPVISLQWQHFSPAPKSGH